MNKQQTSFVLQELIKENQVPHSVEIGTQLGDFEIIGQLGSGGAGAVYRAKNVKTGKEFGLKTLMPGTVANEEIHKRFIREITVAQKLKHENIVAYDTCGLHEDVLFYTMELVPWGTLGEVLSKRRAVTWQEAAECGIHICHGLQHLHENRIVHRDLKPANIFLSDDGRLKIGDFGLARDHDSNRLTIDGQTVGTAKYLAPEQAMAKEIDGRTDLYALGCILFEMIAGRPPFVSDDPYGAASYVQLMQKHVEVPPPKISDYVPACPPALATLIDQLLAKQASDRPQSAGQVATVLAAIIDDPQYCAPETNVEEHTESSDELSLTERLKQDVLPEQKVNLKVLAVIAIVAVVGLTLLLTSQRS